MLEILLPYFTLSLSSCAFLLGRMYDFGHFVEKDSSKALQYYRIAEKKNFRSALNNLGNPPLSTQPHYSNFISVRKKKGFCTRKEIV